MTAHKRVPVSTAVKACRKLLEAWDGKVVLSGEQMGEAPMMAMSVVADAVELARTAVDCPAPVGCEIVLPRNDYELDKPDSWGPGLRVVVWTDTEHSHLVKDGGGNLSQQFAYEPIIVELTRGFDSRTGTPAWLLSSDMATVFTGAVTRWAFVEDAADVVELLDCGSIHLPLNRLPKEVGQLLYLLGRLEETIRKGCPFTDLFDTVMEVADDLRELGSTSG